MKKLLLVTAMIFAAGAAMADPVEGLWKTKPDDNGNYGHVQVDACGAAFCVTVTESSDKLPAL